MQTIFTYYSLNGDTYDVIYDPDRKQFGVIIDYDELTLEPIIRYCNNLDNAKRWAVGLVIVANKVFDF